MNPSPSTALDLLQVAAETLREEVLPHVPAEQRRAALMVSHALGIVARELSATSHLLDVERGVLSRFVRPPEDGSDAGIAVDGMVLGLRRRLASGLRAGQFDAAEAELHQALHALVRLRCSVDAPKALT